MKIAVITAMPEEFRAVADSLGTATAVQFDTLRAGSFSFAGHDFLLVQSGMGFDNAARAAELIIRKFRPELLISAGFCGGIDPELQVGDVVVANTIIIANDNGLEEIPVLLSLLGMTFVALQAAEGRRTFGGTFVSTAAILSKVHLAGMLPRHYLKPVVEMESGAVAIIAAENNIPLLAIRTVSDPANEELGFTLDEFCAPDMRRIIPAKVLLTALRKPHIIPQLLRLSRSSRRAAACLTAAFCRLFPAFQETPRR